MEEVKLYTYAIEKPDLDSDDVLEHYGVKGMRWGIRKDRFKKTGSRRKKDQKTESVTKRDKERALKNRDLEYISKHKSHFSTQEMNDLMNRINTEQRLDQLYRSTKKSRKMSNELKDKIRKVCKTAGAIGITAFAVAALSYSSRKKSGKYLTDKRSLGVMRDVALEFAAVLREEFVGKIPGYNQARKYKPDNLDRMRQGLRSWIKRDR